MAGGKAVTEVIVRLRQWREHKGTLRAPAPDEVHLWWATGPGTTGLADALPSFLSPEEQDRAQRILKDEKRIEFLHGRRLLRVMLGGYLRCHPREVGLAITATGRPFLARSGSTPLDFNLSHASGLVVLAFASHRRVGVDVEACLKASGHGLGLDPRQVEVPVPPPLSVPVRAGAPIAGSDSEWRVLSFDPAPGFVAALAWSGPPEDEPPLVLTGLESAETA